MKRLAGFVFVVAFAFYFWGGQTQGSVRDEGYYFEAAEQYSGWYVELGQNLLRGRPQQSFTRANIDKWFSYNHEHPALMKTLFGLSWRLWKPLVKQGGALHSLFNEEVAFRLPAYALSALMVMVVFLFAAELSSEYAGLVAAALTIAAPRLFFDAQLACFDAPIAAFWVFVVYGYWRALHDQRWALPAAVLLGLALATKHNAFFLPPLLVLHYLWLRRDDLRRFKLPPVPRVFWYFASVSIVVYLFCWPWLWFSTVARFREYVAFHVNHVYYNMEYFGTNYNKPPFPKSFPYVMTLLTLPFTTVILATIGMGVLVVRDFLKRRELAAEGQLVSASPTLMGNASPALLILGNAIFPMAIITITGAPIFGATKHFHASIPFLAIAAGVAIETVVSKLSQHRAARLAAALIVCTPAVLDTYRSHPFGLSHYNVLAGGPQGGATLGMNRQFWGYPTRSLLPWIDGHARMGAPIYWHDTNQSQLNMHMRVGRLRTDLRNSGMEEPGVKSSEIAMVIHEKHFNKYEYWIWDFYGTTKPSVVLDHLGVPIVTVYERPKR